MKGKQPEWDRRLNGKTGSADPVPPKKQRVDNVTQTQKKKGF